jgi:hypothetical protein
MFAAAKVFNQDISDWNVSQGKDFVSDDQALQFLVLMFLVLAVFPSWMPIISITAVWLFGTNNLNQHRTSYFLFSLGIYVRSKYWL